MKIYLDNCCYNRPFDDQSQDRIHFESEAVFAILKKIGKGGYDLIGSSVLELEIDKISDPNRREKVKRLYAIHSSRISISEEIVNRSAEIRNIANIKNMDSLHLASAEKVDADVFITTDDRLIKACQELDLTVKVMNPIEFVMEELK